MTNINYKENALNLGDIQRKHMYFDYAFESLDQIDAETNYNVNNYIIVHRPRARKWKFIIVERSAVCWDDGGYSYRNSGLYRTWDYEEATDEYGY